MAPETGDEKSEVRVTPAQADAAKLIVGIDAATGDQTSGAIRKIADAMDDPTPAARPTIAFVPDDELSRRALRPRRWWRRRKSRRKRQANAAPASHALTGAR